MAKGCGKKKQPENTFNKIKYKNALIWIFQVVGKYNICIVLLSIIQIILGISSVIFAMVFRDLIDYAVSGEIRYFFQSAILLVSIELGQIVLDIIGRFGSEWTNATLENILKNRLFSCLLQKDYSAVASFHSGEWMTRLTSDTVVVTNGIIEICPGISGIFSRLIGALVALFFLSPLFGMIFILAGILVTLSISLLRKILKRLHKEIQEANATVLSFLQERLESLMIIKVFSMEKDTCKAALKKMQQHKAARMKRSCFSSFFNSGLGAVIDGGYLFGAIYCGYGILKGAISYGTFMAVLQLVGQIQSRFVGLSGVVPQYYAMLASAERLMEAELYCDDREENISQEQIITFYRENFRSIGVRNGNFSYKSSEKKSLISDKMLVIDNINLEIYKGEYVALTGHSGCGKSTLFKLLLCLYPLDSGERYLVAKQDDGDMVEIPLTSMWRGLFAYVPQGNQLMGGSIREIIAFGDPEAMAQDIRLEYVLKISCADEFVMELENGIDTILGEHGAGLSEGQMQRIAIARALFSERPILILDEATSALDEITEQKLLENLRQLTDKTVLIITHRPAALQICDREIVMKENK